MPRYTIDIPAMNINGKMVKVNDIGGVVDAATMKEQDDIKKIEDKIKLQSTSQLAYSKLINLNTKLKSACNYLRNTSPYDVSTSTFDEKLAVAVGMTPETMLAYFDVDANAKASLGLMKIEIDRIATAEKWRSKSFSSKLSSVTQGATGSDSNMFKEGKFEVKIQNNSKRLRQNFTYTPAVDNSLAGKFEPGTFTINGIDITLSNGDNLEEIVQNINKTVSGVTAELIDDKDNTKALVLNSDNDFIISDPKNIFTNLANASGQYLVNQKDSPSKYSKRFVQAFDLYPTVVTINDPHTFHHGTFYINNRAISLKEGDNLVDVAKKINMSNLGVEAKVETVGKTNLKANLVLRSTSFGTEYDYFIDDPNNILVDLANLGGDYLEQFNEYETIQLDKGDSLTTITAKINAFKDKTCLGAELAEVSRGSIRLLLTSTSTGIGNKFEIKDHGIIVDGKNPSPTFQRVFQDGTEKDGITPYTHLVIAAQDALLKIDDTELSRSINKISDFREGLTVILKQATKQPMKVNIISNTEGIVKAVQRFVDQYNDVLKFITKQRHRDENGKLVEGAVLGESDVAKKEESEMRMQATRLVQAGIGLRTIEIPQEIIDDKKEPKYSGILEVDVPTLVGVLNDDVNKVKNVFDYDFESTSPDFAPPISRKNTIITIGALSTTVDSYEIAMDKDKATVKSTRSIGFDNNKAPVVSNKQKKGQFTAGSFYINNRKITIGNDQSLEDIAKAINSISLYSRVSASIVQEGGKYFLDFKQYSGSDANYTDKIKFEKMFIYDPNRVLNDLFEVQRETVELGTNLSKKIFNIGTFKLNEVDITMSGHTITDLVNAINGKKAQTRVEAKAILNDKAKYVIYLTSLKPQALIIDDSVNNVFNGKLDSVVLGKGNYFWDTSSVFTAKANTSRGAYNKAVKYELADNNDLNSGFISINNLDDSKLKIHDFSLAYVGESKKETTSIVAKPGIAEWLANYIDVLNGSLYNGGSGEIQNDIKNLQKNKERLENDKKLAEDNLQRKQQSLRSQYAKLNAGVESMTQQLQLLDILNNPTGDK